MKNRVTKWLERELPLWKEKGWLTEAGENELEATYLQNQQSQGPSLTRIAILFLGGALIALGVFLLFAGYWYSFSPNGRFDWTITLVVIALIVLSIGMWRGEPGKRLAEGVALFYMLALGGSTFLMADTYYTGESYGLYLLIVLFVSLPTIYILRSSLGMILYLLGSILWCFAPSSLDGSLNIMAVWFLIVGALPFYVIAVRHSNSYSLLVWLSWAYVAAVFSAFFLTIESNKAGLELYFITVLSAVTYALGVLNRSRGLWTLPFRTIGAIGLFYVVVQGTLLQTWNTAIQEGLQSTETTIALLFSAVSIYFLFRLLQNKEWVAFIVNASPFVIGFALLLSYSGATPLVVSLVFDVYVMLVAIGLFVRGTIDKRVGYINGAIIAIFAMIVARFFDPSFTFLERGISFISVGILVFLVNIVYMWAKFSRGYKKTQQERKVRREANKGNYVAVDEEEQHLSLHTEMDERKEKGA